MSRTPLSPPADTPALSPSADLFAGAPDLVPVEVLEAALEQGRAQCEAAEALLGFHEVENPFRFARGQRVCRDMGPLGGHAFGTVVRLPGDPIEDLDEVMPRGRVAVLFGSDARTGITIGFDLDDPYLCSAPTDVDLQELLAADAKSAMEAAVLVDSPLFPVGTFGEEPAGFRRAAHARLGRQS